MDPFSRQQTSKAVHGNNLQIRTKLYNEGRELEKRYHKISRDGTRDEKLQMLGELQMYVSIRNSLAPDVGLDQHTRTIEGYANKLKKSCEQ